MSFTSTIGQISALSTNVTSLATLIGGGSTQAYAGTLNNLGAWASGMQVATWRGIPFAVRESVITKGRRVAEHVYPNRDTVYVEDMGRGVRRYTFRGFLVGDDVLQQSLVMQQAVEQAGAGRLVHPALGGITCMAPTVSFQQGTQGRVIELDMQFVETEPTLFPVTLDATQDLINSLTGGAFDAINLDFINDAVSAIEKGADVVASVVSTVTGWTNVVLGVVGRADLLFRSVTGLAGIFGRYSSGSRTSLQSSSSTAALLLAASTSARTAVQSQIAAANALSGSSATEEASSLATSVAALTESVRAMASSPIDQINLLAELATYTATTIASTAPIGAAMVTASEAAAAVCRRSALVSLAAACSDFAPSSSEDATSVLSRVTALFDAEMLIAADGEDLGTWQSFRELRAAVATDLTDRGAQLPSQRAFSFPGAQPSLALAYRIYEDASRSDDLIQRVDPIHPAFMPADFTALSA